MDNGCTFSTDSVLFFPQILFYSALPEGCKDLSCLRERAESWLRVWPVSGEHYPAFREPQIYSQFHLFFIKYINISLIPVTAKIIPAFSVTWSFWNHSNMLIWSSGNIYFYLQCWNQFYFCGNCEKYFFRILWWTKFKRTAFSNIYFF